MKTQSSRVKPSKPRLNQRETFVKKKQKKKVSPAKNQRNEAGRKNAETQQQQQPQQKGIGFDWK